jgi:hypothetical protein
MLRDAGFTAVWLPSVLKTAIEALPQPHPNNVVFCPLIEASGFYLYSQKS